MPIIQHNAALATNKVVQIRTMFSAPFPSVEAWYHGNGFREIQSGYIRPALMPGSPWAQGRVNWGVGTATFHGKQIYAQVDYRHHRWYRSPPLDYRPDGPRPSGISQWLIGARCAAGQQLQSNRTTVPAERMRR